jgi:hypothetical protein
MFFGRFNGSTLLTILSEVEGLCLYLILLRAKDYEKSFSIFMWHGLPGHSAELSRSPREDTAKMAVPPVFTFGDVLCNLAECC